MFTASIFKAVSVFGKLPLTLSLLSNLNANLTS